MVCKDFGAGTEPKDVAVDEADMSLYEDNGHFDMAKFLKAIADPNHWVVINFQRRFEALSAMLAIVSAHRQPTGLTILIFGPELEKSVQPVLRQRFTKSQTVSQLFTLDNTGGSVPAGVCPYHMSAGRPRTRTERKHAHAHWARLCASHGRGRAPRSCGAWRAGLMGGGKKAIDAIALSLKVARVVSDAAKQVRIPSVGVDRRVRAAGCVQAHSALGLPTDRRPRVPSSAGGGAPHGLAAVLRREWTSRTSRPMSCRAERSHEKREWPSEWPSE